MLTGVGGRTGHVSNHVPLVLSADLHVTGPS